MDTSLLAGGLVAIGLPLIAALALAVRALRPLVAAAAPWTPLPALALAMWGGPVGVVDVPWLLLGTRLGLDDISRVFLFFTAALWIVCGAYARTYLTDDPRRHHLLAFFLTSMAGNIGVALAADMITFYVFFALMSFASYGLIVHERDPGALRAGRIYIAFVVAGEVLLFVGIVGSAGIAGHSSFSAVGEAMSRSSSGHLMLACIVAGFAIKTGTVPLHPWMPLAYQAAPIPGGAALSGPMIKAGLLGWLQFVPLGTMPLPALGVMCLIAGFASGFWGVVVGLTQKDPRTALAYSSISQMGLMTAGIGIGLLSPESWPLLLPAIWLYALHHAFAKSALFLGAGIASHAASGLWRRTVIAGLALGALALAGVPLSSGGVAKIALKKGIESASIPYGAVELLLSIAAIGTTLLMARVLALVISRGASIARQAPAGLWLPWAVSLAGVVLAVWTLPWRGFRDAAFESLAPSYLWATLWPPAIGIGISAAVWQSTRLSRALARLDVPAGDLLVALLALVEFVRRISRIRERAVPLVAPPRHRRQMAVGALAIQSMRIERGLQRWGVVGVLVLALLSALFALLAGRSM